jgi:4-carboxymuconolactone decarboxylase
MGLPGANEMTSAQQDAADEMVRGPRGAVAGPFVPMLRSPELMTRVQRVGELLRFGETSLAPDLREMVVLVVAARWDARYEWGSHIRGAADAGIPREVCDAISRGAAPSGLTPRLGAGYDLVAALLDGAGVPDELYDRAVGELGEQGVIDVAVLAGYYTTLAFVLSAADVPGEDPPAPLPALPPRG